MAKALNVSLAVTADTGQAKAQLQQLQQHLQQLTTSSANLKIGISADEIQKASQAALELSAHLKTATNVNTGTIDFTKLNSSIRSSGQSLEAYGRQLMKLGPQGRQAFMELAQSVAKSEIPIKRISGLLGNFGTVLQNTIRWQLSSSMIHGFMGAIQSAYGYAQDLNKSLNNIQIVTQMSDNQMISFAKSANVAAKALSTTTTSYTDAALIYYQQGIRDQKEIAERTDATIKMANVTGQSAQEVSNQMTAIWNNFADGSQSLEYYADVITALGAATASSSAEISTGLQKFAAVADTVGLSYENATAALATITATTRQSADTVGTGLRTVFSRLQSLSLGETLDDGVTLTKYSKAMQKIGVDVLDATGNLRAMDDILMDMGEKWQDLTDAQKTATAQTIGGVRQYTTIMALMENFDFYKENLDVAKNSEGTLQKQQDIYEKSWAAAAKRVRASAESIYSSLIDDKFFTQLTDGFAKFLDIINDIIAGLGGMKGVLLSLGGALTSVFSSQIAGGLYKFGVGVRDLFSSPKALAARRDAFVANSANILMGKNIPIDNKTGQADLTGLSAMERASYQNFVNQIQNQQAFSKNAPFMTAEQRDAAIKALDIQDQAGRTAAEAEQRAITAETRLDDSRDMMYHQSRLNLGKAFDLSKTQAYERTRGRLDTAEQTFSQEQQLLAGLRDGTITREGLTASQQSMLQSLRDRTANQYQAKTGQGFSDISEEQQLEEMRRQSRSTVTGAREEFVKTMTSDKFKVDEKTARGYVENQQAKIQADQEKESANERKKAADENAKKATEQYSIAMKAAQGVTNVAGGMMSGLAAQAGLDSFVNTIQQANAGLLSTKEAATQGVSAVASMAMNGARAFSQFSAALGPIGGAIATVATVALPYLIDMFDNMYETDAEKMERLNSQVEMAQNDLTQARQEYKDIFSDFDSHSKAIEGLNKMTAGTREFKDAVREANTQAEELIDKYNLIENQDYYTDRNGAIHFRSGLEDELAQQKDQEIAQKEQALELAEFNRDINQLRQDKGKIEEAERKARQDYIDAHSDYETGQYWGTEEELNAYAQAHTKDYIDKALAEQYGYKSAEAMANAYFSDEAGLNAQMSAKSGIAKQYADVLEAQAKADDGKISDLEELSNQVLENQFDALGTDQFKMKRNAENMWQGEKDYVEYETEEGMERVNLADANNRKVNTERRERVYKAQLEALYGVEEAERMYNELIESQGYQGLTEKQKQQKLNALLEQQELQKMVEDVAKENQEALKQVDVSKYEGFKQKKGKDLIATARAARDGAYKDENGDWYDKNGQKMDEQAATRMEAEEQLANAVAQQWGESAANLQQVLMAQTNLNMSSQQLAETMAQDFSIEDMQSLSTYTNMFGQMFGKETAGYVFSELTNEMKNGGSDLLDALDSINWSDSKIDNIFSLKEAINNIDDGQTELKSKLQTTLDSMYKDSGGDAGLLQELYGSDAFADTLEDLKESFDEMGEISADSILSAAKGCKQLSKFLDITDVNAQGLADVLESIAIGDIGIDQVTDGLLQAMSAAGELNNNLAQVYEHIDNFKLDRSISDIGKFYKGLADQVESSQGAGMLLDKPLLQSWGELFGQDSLQAYKDWTKMATDQKNWTPQQISDDFNEQFAAEIAAMQSIQERGNLSGMFEYAFNRAGKNAPKGGKAEITDAEGNLAGYADSSGQIFDAAGEALMHFDETTGQVVTDNDANFQEMFSHQSDFIDYLTDNLDVPREMAEAMAAEFATTDSWAHDMWGQEAAQEGYNKLVETLEKGNDLTATELRAFYNQYGEFFKDFKNFDEFAAHFRQQTKDMGGSLIDLGKNFNYAEATYDDLVKAMSDQEGEQGLDAYLQKQTKSYNRAGGAPTDKMVESASNTGQYRDVQELQQAYMQLGFTASQANALIDESGQKLVGQARNLDGTLRQFAEDDAAYQEYLTKNQIEHSAEAMQAYIENTEQMAQTAQSAQIFADAFKQAFDGNPIQVTYENGEIPEVPDASATVNYTGNFDNVGTPPTLNGTVEYSATYDNGPGPGCFIGGSKILMFDKSYKNIENIKIGDMVISYNENNQQFEIDEVVDIFIHTQINRLVTIYYNNNTSITMTLGHPLLSVNGWKSLDLITSLQVHNVNASLLNIGDNFISYKNEKIKIIDIKIIQNKEAVYNFSTKYNHTYIVNDIIAHNKYTGYRNNRTPNIGFKSGLKAGEYEGWAALGEQGDELWIHDGVPYLAGIHGPTQGFIHKDDIVYTHPQTQKILEDNPSLQDIPGFSVGYNRITWGRKGTGANAGNAKTSKYEPERYHLITRQLKDLQREYDRLDKIKENCYGTNKLEAIQREIDATNELIKGQKELVKEAEDYLAIDTNRLKDLLGAGEFQVDENGNLLNFEELQEKYRKKAEEDKDEHAQDVWKALQQYEETLDKLQEANVEMQDLLYQEMELRLEKITTKVDMHIDFDDREIKLLDHYIKRIDDNIYHTAEVLALTEEKLGHINQKIEDTKEGIHELFAEMSDSEGNLITKADGTAYTLDEWLALTNEERDLLDINGKFGEQLEEYMDNLLDYIEELEEFKTKGVEEFGDAFDELNDNVRSSIDLFDHYNQLLSSLKNITDLQGIKLTAELKAARKEIDQIMFQNTQNNIQAEGENYKRLVSEVEDLRIKIANTQDETLKQAWEEQLKTAEEQLRTSEQNMLSLWETGLEQAKDMFEQALQDIVDAYESAIAGMYGTVDELEKAWDQQKKNDDFYVKDFEKYYQIQKLQRSITKDLDAAARAGNKQNQGLKKLYDDLNAAREDGVELSAYDLDIYAKRYEYEKALMELEDARNNKNEVRLQRDANGNWGYVYTSAADEDDLIAKQQAVDDKFYELQKATQERIASLSDDLMSEITGVGKRLQELHSSGASQDTIKKYLEQEKLYLENYEKGLAKALEDAGMTEEEARNRYGNAGFDILNDFQETLFSAITGGDEGLNEFFKRVSGAVTNADSQMVQAGSEYQKQVSAIDKWFNESGEDLAKVIQGFASIVGEESSGTLLDSKEQIDNAKQTFTDILQVARDFEQEFMTIYQPIIDANEQLVTDLLEALHALNREEYEGPNHNKPTTTDIQSNSNITRMATGGYTGSWGSEGRMAILDEKELVLNKDDTENFLNATTILRTLDLQTGLFSKGLGSIITPLIANMQQGTLDQNVHIDATFPNVTDHSEIEAAFDNLINKASQYANRKNMSSMTFNDMYISKF